MHFISVIEENNQACTPRFDEQDVASKTETDTLYNNTNSNIDANIAKGKSIQKELFNYEGKNDVFVKYQKGTEQTKKRKELFIDDKGNV